LGGFANYCWGKDASGLFSRIFDGYHEDLQRQVSLHALLMSSEAIPVLPEHDEVDSRFLAD
jgi:hypothetical protein